MYGRASLVLLPAGRPDACQFMLVVDGPMNGGVFWPAPAAVGPDITQRRHCHHGAHKRVGVPDAIESFDATPILSATPQSRLSVRSN
ncbi:MAG: hypothetical protein P8M20_11070 [Planctomycetaceae bacterium]|nr:hypothetical protein [Planctomycetaceae bacterium]